MLHHFAGCLLWELRLRGKTTSHTRSTSHTHTHTRYHISNRGSLAYVYYATHMQTASLYLTVWNFCNMNSPGETQTCSKSSMLAFCSEHACDWNKYMYQELKQLEQPCQKLLRGSQVTCCMATHNLCCQKWQIYCLCVSIQYWGMLNCMWELEVYSALSKHMVFKQLLNEFWVDHSPAVTC